MKGTIRGLKFKIYCEVLPQGAVTIPQGNINSKDYVKGYKDCWQKVKKMLDYEIDIEENV